MIKYCGMICVVFSRMYSTDPAAQHYGITSFLSAAVFKFENYTRSRMWN